MTAEKSLLLRLHDAIQEQKVDQCLQLLQHPSFRLAHVLSSNKEWYFVVLENNLTKMTKILSSPGPDAYQTLRKSIQNSIKLANTYARRENVLERAVQLINSTVEMDDPRGTMAVLVEHDTCLNGIPRRLAKCKNEGFLEALSRLIHQEIHAAIQDKGAGLTFDELTVALEVLDKVAQLNEALTTQDVNTVYEAISVRTALWENVMENVGDVGRLYLDRLLQARTTKQADARESSNSYWLNLVVYELSNFYWVVSTMGLASRREVHEVEPGTATHTRSSLTVSPQTVKLIQPYAMTGLAQSIYSDVFKQ